jgi:hypothetical protein
MNTGQHHSAGKELGIFFLYSGESRLSAKRILYVFVKKHGDCQFLAFTNRTLMMNVCRRNAARRNFIPAITLRVLKTRRISPRRQGTYHAVIRAMEILKRKKLIFGALLLYAVYPSDRQRRILRFLMTKGEICVVFTYIPWSDVAPDLDGNCRPT